MTAPISDMVLSVARCRLGVRHSPLWALTLQMTRGTNTRQSGAVDDDIEVTHS